MALSATVKKILQGQGLVKLERIFREIPTNLTGKERIAAELAAVGRQYSGTSIPARRSLAKITRDAIAYSTRLENAGRNKAGLRANIPIVEGLRFNDANSAGIRYSVAIDVYNPNTGIRKYLTPNILSNTVMTLDELRESIQRNLLSSLTSSPAILKMLDEGIPTVETIHRVLALRNH